MKRFLSYLGWVLFVFASVSVFFIAGGEDTIDFRGIVRSICESSEDNCFYFTATPITDGDAIVKIKADKDISVREITGEKMSIYDIEAGDMIDLNHKGEISDLNCTVEAKWIKVCKTATNAATR